MNTTRNAMLAAVCLGALHDILLHAVVGDHAVQEPDGPGTAEADEAAIQRGFAPGSRASADLSGQHTKTTLGDEAAPAAVSEEFAAGMEHARRLFAGQEEARYAMERDIDRQREDLNFHCNLRLHCLNAANLSHLTKDEVVKRASAFYDFLCYGVSTPNLGCATTAELSIELAARLADPVSAQPDYRTVD